MYVGIDIGSSSSKVAIMNDEKKIVGTYVVNRGTGTDGEEIALHSALNEANLTEQDIKYTVVTGYGRIAYEKADKQITEITCHAKGVTYLVPDADTIIDIGGQDSKAIKLAPNGTIENFVMNEKCAAGTGRFMEVMARVLNTDLDKLSALADKAQKEVSISSVCTVFAETEVISRLSAKERMEDVAKGANVAIAKRVAGMCKRVGIGNKVVMTGGVALNDNMVRTMGEVLGVEVTAAPHCQAVGAVGAAILAYENYQKKMKA